ncbi:conserved exported hypothetical protein [Flavobacterium sp. 9AF]|uniref:BT1926 family outer membrane beta-barrel protein n=1 Tax=Flavobacterium sp. 9AF TaxID=2653142 RepID=UPI0012F29DE5|nr:BT1926 family outer membrane beta-barrel protein [Flavobacterium sp. 9AF]VXB42920.1 conserved exported hypothetical protein [Flavobacterium sp. 9AF]
MKKLLIGVLTILAYQNSNAQEEITYKPTTGTITTEVGLTGGLNNANFNLNGGVLKFRYFLKEDLGVRLGLGVYNSNDEDVTGQSPNQITYTDKLSSNTIKLGIEKHFAGANRLSTYAGADLLVRFGKELDEENEENGDFQKTESKNSSFGVAIFTGADYYITQKVFLGVEAGLNFLSTKYKDEEYSFKNGNNTGSSSDPGKKESDFVSNVFGGVRIGFQF